MTTLKPLEYENVLHVAKNMREMDKEEIYATRWSDKPEDLARDAMLIPQMCWTAHKEDRPVAAFGAIPIHPGVWTVWMFATDEWPAVSLLVTRHIIKRMIPTIRRRDDSVFKRAECRSHHLHHVAHRWLEYLGASKESTAYRYGKNGENFFVFAWY
jgi:hypothetical protein